MTDLIILGSVNLDVVLRVRALPKPGETIATRSVDQFLGGKGANQAVSASRSGAETMFHACVGDDAQGEWLISELQGHSVSVERIGIEAGERSGRAYVCVDDAGENHIVLEAGANNLLEFDQAVSKSSRVVLSQLETPISTTRKFFLSALDAGVKTVLNAAPAVFEARTGLFPLADILVVNESELAFYAGVDRIPEDIEDITRIARALISREGQVIIVTCGAAGALAISLTGFDVTPARRTRAKDTTGSGDCFCGALCARLSMGDDLSTAMQYASVAASLSVEKEGAAASMPSRTDVELIIFEMQPEEIPG